MDIKLTYPKLINFRRALSLFGALPRIPEGYANSKNLQSCNRIIDALDEIKNDLFKKAAERDEEGGIRLFDKIVPDKDGETKEGRVTDKKALKDYSDEMEKFWKVEHEIAIHQVPYARFEKYIAENGMNNNILAPLLDIYITDGEVGEEKAKAK